jgi:hypothetical protein
MENINNLFDQEITKTMDAYPSIYTKDDVVSLLSKLRTIVLTEVSELKPTGNVFTAKYITDSVEDLLQNFDYEEFITSEPDLCGSYGSSFTLELNTNFDEYQFAKSFTNELTDYFKSNPEENDDQN